MSPTCPIAKETIDDRAARLCALIVLLPLGVSLALRSPWPALGLAADFGLRGFGRRRWSPVSWLSRWLVSRLGLSPQLTNGGPKAFAAKLGFGFALVLTVAFLFGQVAAGFAAGLPFALCAVLEGAFGYCVGCRIYQLSHRLWPAPRATAAPSVSR